MLRWGLLGVSLLLAAPSAWAQPMQGMPMGSPPAGDRHPPRAIAMP
jgi:hypothetical protein